MTAEYPLLILPAPSDQDKARRTGRGQQIHRPDIAVQGRRLAPKLERLTHAFERQHIQVQLDPDGIEPEFALVFEVADSLNSFYGAVKRIEGLEWLFDFDDEGIEPDEIFYDEKHKDSTYTGRVYCIMSDQAALIQMLNAWNSYQRDPDYKFARGLTSLRDLFLLLRDVRMWSPSDRFEETGIMEKWRYEVEFTMGSTTTFEAELFFRGDASKRSVASQNVRAAIASMNGRVITECVIEEICYHGMLIELPRTQIENLLSDQRDSLALATCNEVMFYRPTAQMAIDGAGEILDEPNAQSSFEDRPSGMPIVALFDGLPLENHAALRGRLMVDDPDDFAGSYPVKQRRHGTAMASMLAHGDLANDDCKSLTSPIYVRPTMRADTFGIGEEYPQDMLIVDVIHRAVKRMYDGDGDEPASAPSVCVINLSLGDRARQYLRTPSPLAKLLDWLSCKYRVLFVISAGNQKIDMLPIDGGYETLCNLDLADRTSALGNAVKTNRRNMRILSPAETLNAVTVGATFADLSEATDQVGAIEPVAKGYVSPISSFGGGGGRSIKPEILYPGGRFYVRGGDGDTLEIIDQMREPGIKVAAPSTSPVAQAYAYDVGTSYSAAAVTHECGLNYETLIEVFQNAGYSGVPDKFAALLLKAMTAHGAVDSASGEIALTQFDANKQDMTDWVGFGVPDFGRVRECAVNRVTTVGYGVIGKDEGQLFTLPLPIDLRNMVVKRRLIATLAYFSPVTYSRKEYRRASLWFERVGLTKDRLVPERGYTNWQAIRRGTLQHQVFYGDRALAWSEETDSIELLVSCTTTNHLQSLGKERIPYALLLTFEAEGVIDVYQPVANRLRVPVPIEHQAN